MAGEPLHPRQKSREIEDELWGKYFIELSEYTKNPTWKQRAVSMWNVATAGISNGTLELMDRGPRPVGAQDETYNHTDWGYYYAATGNLDERNPRGAGSQWLVAWPTALRLDILADAETRKVVEQIPVCRTRSDLPPNKWDSKESVDVQTDD